MTARRYYDDELSTQARQRRRQARGRSTRGAPSRTMLLLRRAALFAVLAVLVLAVTELAWSTLFAGPPPAVRAPGLQGLTARAASRQARTRGLELVVSGRRYSPTFRAGTVCRQIPRGGAKVEAGAHLVVFLSRGPDPRAAVPKLTGVSLLSARAALARVRLRAVVAAPFAGASDGVVVASQPAAGSRLRKGSSVVLVLYGAGRPAGGPAAKRLAAAFRPTFAAVEPETISQADTKQKLVAITLDDGGGTDMRILDLFARRKIHPTAFVTGQVVDEHPELIAKLDRLGWEVTNHTYTHSQLTRMSDGGGIQELKRTQLAISRITGKVFPYMRPPGGATSVGVRLMAASIGYKTVLWSDTFSDTGIISAQEHANFVLRTVHPGSIILGHFGGDKTYEALSIVLPELERRGFRVVSLSELLRAK